MNDGIEREYRRHRGVPAASATLGAVAIFVVVTALNSLSSTGLTDWQVLILVLWLFIGARVVLEQWWARTFVTADGVTVRGPLRTRTWAWADVYGIWVEEVRRGSPRWQAYLYGGDGRRVRLHHLDELQVDAPADEAADLCATAVRLGLASFGTRPEVEERILRAARRRTAWQRALLADLVVVVAMFVLDGWMIFTDRPTHSYLLLLGVPLLCLPVFFLFLDRLGETFAARRSPDHA
ncbi:PH domain-containing protein [Streptomyces prunicolor]|uniref:PH domain-containing protein n=1 Tax=Streptomyces prunicolor TaxID=67348 RepID=A0ABU4F5G2_9ACTN|nr:PH domain-containing protein [Streptomyces prunicolor]MDV7214505.1 PH domain-containing protein [Streptomyces prunicolor]